MIDNTDERARGEVDVRLEELALYVAGCFDGDPSFDATELDKILFYADFIAYFRNGEPITGAEYQRLQHGPAPRELEPVERDLVKRRFAQVRLVPLRKPNFALFSGSEIGIVDEVIRSRWRLTMSMQGVASESRLVVGAGRRLRRRVWSVGRRLVVEGTTFACVGG